MLELASAKGRVAQRKRGCARACVTRMGGSAVVCHGSRAEGREHGCAAVCQQREQGRCKCSGLVEAEQMSKTNHRKEGKGDERWAEMKGTGDASENDGGDACWAAGDWAVGWPEMHRN